MNLYPSGYRKRRPVLIGLEETPELRAVQAHDGGFEQRNEAELLHRAVVALPRKYREAIIVFYLQYLNLAEAAEVLQVAQGTLKTRLFRGREMLRKNLENQERGRGRT